MEVLKRTVDTLKGVGKKRAEQLSDMGIETINDLVEYFPRQGSYIDFAKALNISDLEYDKRQIFRAQIVAIAEKRSLHAKRYAQIRLRDATGYAEVYLFGGQIYKTRYLKNGMDVIVTGKVQQGKFATSKIISEATIEPDDGSEKNSSILPVYSLSGNISQHFLRSLIESVLNELQECDLPEILPRKVLQEKGLINRFAAIKNIHFPQNHKMLLTAKNRLVFEELFLLQYSLLHYKKLIKTSNKGYKHDASKSKIKKMLSLLPFKLTKEQLRAWHDIESDMQDITPMHRLLQGDVGSGKTVIAFLALLKAIESGYQGALMAPTEILAMQHYETMQLFFKGLDINFDLLTGSTPTGERKRILEDLQLGNIDILIGTHALIQSSVIFKNLSLVVTDEQHRFGVRQRAELSGKSRLVPDTLVMTATPIPRTMALTVYGDLDVSLIKELPPGRKPIMTLCYNETKRDAVYRGVVRQIKLGRQAYIVCPLIEESEKIQSLSAEQLYKTLKSTFLKNIPVALLHGRMKPAEKDAIMADFVKNKIKVLISTTVIEVGINVPNASLMIVEGAERFGLSQLHQLRGRIGRGEHQSYCALISSNKSQQTAERLNLMCQYSDGFSLAEEDLRLRGAGELFGTRQHGMPDLKLANMFSDIDILLAARESAMKTLENSLETDYMGEYIKMKFKNMTSIFSS